MSFFTKIGDAFKWFGKEVGKIFTELPKIITLTEDAEAAATTALPEVLQVVQDAGALVTASAKDSGVFFEGLATLTAAIAAAFASKALDVAQDVAVAAAFAQFCKDFNAANVSDVIAAWDTLAKDVSILDATVIATLKKMETDAGVTPVPAPAPPTA